MKRIFSMILATALMCSMLTVGVSASTGSTKTFTMKSGDSMTISNYVAEKTSEMVIDGEKTALTYYLVDDNTKITFDIRNEQLSGDIIGTEFSDGEYMTFGSSYIGGEWGWDEIKAVDLLTSSISDGTNTSYEYYTLAGVFIADFQGGQNAVDYIELYVMEAEQTAKPATVTAMPTSSKVLVNGNETSFDAYNINDNNYFKIRDIASVLSGTGKQFNVIWDKELQAVSMTSNQAYTVVGGEMAKGDGTNKSATLNTAKVYMDSKEVSLTAYNIGGNNYVKLRDLGQLFDFGVRWDGSVVIDTSTGYEVETPKPNGDRAPGFDGYDNEEAIRATKEAAERAGGTAVAPGCIKLDPNEWSM